MKQPLRQPFDDDAAETRVSRLKLCGYVLALWSFIFMLPHFYFAVGGKVGLAYIHADAPLLPQWRLINWVAVAALFVVSLLGLVLPSLSGQRAVRPMVLAFVWIGCSLGLSHAFYGLGSRTLTVIDHVSARSDVPSYILADLLVFEPWFLIEAILLGLCGWFFLSDRRDRHRWLIACAAGSLVALGAALLQLRIA